MATRSYSRKNVAIKHLAIRSYTRKNDTIKTTKASIPHSKKKTTKPSNKISLTNNWIKMSNTDLGESIIRNCLPCYHKNKPLKTDSSG